MSRPGVVTVRREDLARILGWEDLWNYQDSIGAGPVDHGHDCRGLARLAATD